MTVIICEKHIKRQKRCQLGATLLQSYGLQGSTERWVLCNPAFETRPKC